MKFSTREDIDAPIDEVFHQLCDFETFERQAIKRGADVTRTDTLRSPGVGMRWATAFTLRGRRREMDLQMVEFTPPTQMRLEASSAGVDADFELELISLSRTRTRITIGLDLRPKNLSARLMVQSLKLAKGSLTKRFKLRVAEYAHSIEERLRKSA